MLQNGLSLYFIISADVKVKCASPPQSGLFDTLLPVLQPLLIMCSQNLSERSTEPPPTCARARLCVCACSCLSNWSRLCPFSQELPRMLSSIFRDLHFCLIWFYGAVCSGAKLRRTLSWLLQFFPPETSFPPSSVSKLQWLALSLPSHPQTNFSTETDQQ